MCTFLNNCSHSFAKLETVPDGYVCCFFGEVMPSPFCWYLQHRLQRELLSYIEVPTVCCCASISYMSLFEMRDLPFMPCLFSSPCWVSELAGKRELLRLSLPNSSPIWHKSHYPCFGIAEDLPTLTTSL